MLAEVPSNYADYFSVTVEEMSFVLYAFCLEDWGGRGGQRSPVDWTKLLMNLQKEKWV